MIALLPARADTAEDSITIPVDTRDYILVVESAYGNPSPPVGGKTFAWGSAVVCSVDSPFGDGGALYRCTGWSGNQGAGSGHQVALELTDLETILTWNWALDATVYADLTQITLPGRAGDFNIHGSWQCSALPWLIPCRYSGTASGHVAYPGRPWEPAGLAGRAGTRPCAGADASIFPSSGSGLQAVWKQGSVFRRLDELYAPCFLAELVAAALEERAGRTTGCLRRCDPPDRNLRGFPERPADGGPADGQQPRLRARLGGWASVRT